MRTRMTIVKDGVTYIDFLSVDKKLKALDNGDGTWDLFIGLKYKNKVHHKEEAIHFINTGEWI